MGTSRITYKYITVTNFVQCGIGGGCKFSWVGESDKFGWW